MEQLLTISQAVISILLIIFVLLQKGGGAGGLFGQEARFYRTLRGAEKKLFFATIALGFLFIILGFLNLIF